MRNSRKNIPTLKNDEHSEVTSTTNMEKKSDKNHPCLPLTSWNMLGVWKQKHQSCRPSLSAVDRDTSILFCGSSKIMCRHSNIRLLIGQNNLLKQRTCNICKQQFHRLWWHDSKSYIQFSTNDNSVLNFLGPRFISTKCWKDGTRGRDQTNVLMIIVVCKPSSMFQCLRKVKTQKQKRYGTIRTWRRRNIGSCANENVPNERSDTNTNIFF